MKAAIFVLACVLLAGPAFASRSLNQFTSGTCAAYGSLSVVVKHGSCNGFAKAQCTTFAKAEAVIEEAFEAGVTFDFCNEITVQASAAAIAEALAEVYVESLARVSCDGLGFGCGFALASGDSFATAYARSFAKAVAAALSDKLSSVCVADLEAFGAGIADVAASANAKACVNGSGSAEAFRSEFVQAVTTVMTNAIATVTAEICIDGKETAECTAEVSGSSEVGPFETSNTEENDVVVPGTNPFDGPNTATGGTTSSADSRKIKPCEGPKGRCCTKSCKFGFLGADLTGAHNLVLFDFGGKAQCWCH